MRKSRSSWLVTTLGAVALLGAPCGDTVAKRKFKNQFVARANGKKLKGSKIGTSLYYAGTSFSVNGQTKVKRGLSRELTAGCGGDLKTLTLPATLSCYGSYSEVRKKGAKEWTRADGMTVTVTSFDGSRAVGTFTGTLDTTIAHPTDPPVTIENGSFSIIIADFGI